MQLQVQSRQSKVLDVTQWLSQASDEGTVLFLSHLGQHLNVNSLGKLIATLLIRSQKQFSNDTIESLLEFITKSKQNTESSHAKKKRRVCKSKDASAHPFLSLPQDTLTYFGWFLTKHESIELGYCCHDLYRLTQSKDFLFNAGFHHLELTLDKLRKISEFDIDPWIWAVNCTSLCLGDVRDDTYASWHNYNLYNHNYNQLHLESLHLNQNVKSAMKCIEKCVQLNEKQSDTNWFETIFETIEYLRAEGLESMALSYIPIKTLFQTQRLNKNSNQIEFIHRDPLSLELVNLNPTFAANPKDRRQGVQNRAHLLEFFQKYKNFYSNYCQGDLSRIRPIESIVLDYKSLQHIKDLLPFMHPNYHSLIISDGFLEFSSLQDIKNVFHPNLNLLRCFGMSLGHLMSQEHALVREVLQAAADAGHVFDIDNLSQFHELTGEEREKLDAARRGGDLPAWLNSVLTSRNGPVPGEDALYHIFVTYPYVTGNFDVVFVCKLYARMVKQWLGRLIQTQRLNLGIRELCNVQHLELMDFDNVANGMDSFNNVVCDDLYYTMLNFDESVESVTLSFTPTLKLRYQSMRNNRLTLVSIEDCFRFWSPKWSDAMDNVALKFNKMTTFRVDINFRYDELMDARERQDENPMVSRENLMRLIELFCDFFKFKVESFFRKLFDKHPQCEIRLRMLVGNVRLYALDQIGIQFLPNDRCCALEPLVISERWKVGNVEKQQRMNGLVNDFAIDVDNCKARMMSLMHKDQVDKLETGVYCISFQNSV